MHRRFSVVLLFGFFIFGFLIYLVSFSYASALVYSTYLGGGNYDFGQDIAIDSSGNAYITGRTYSSDFPTTLGAFDTSFNGGTGDVFVTKLNTSGTALIYSTYLGGTGDDYGQGIAIDSSGNAYITGRTYSFDFPTTPGAFITTYDSNIDCFITKLNAEGSALIYATFFPAASGPIVIDSIGNAYMAGRVTFSNAPTTPGAFDTSFNGGIDILVSKLNSTGTALIYSTFLGGTNTDAIYGYGLAIDSIGNTYIAGHTSSSDFPTTTNAFDTTFNGGEYDVFITKLNATGTGLIYSTFLGGSDRENPWGIAIDDAGNAYVTGDTLSNDFPTTPGVFSQILSSNVDSYVSKLNDSGSSLIYSTFLGGNGGDETRDIAIDSTGNVYVSGWTQSPDFPTTINAFDRTFNGDADTFITKINPYGSSLLYSTFLGGSATDYSFANTIDNAGNIYITGRTISPNYPTTLNAFDTSFRGDWDCFVSKIEIPFISILSVTPDRGANSASVTVVLRGDKFENNVIVKLTRFGEYDIIGYGTQVVDFSIITTTFELTGRDTGSWNIVVINPDSKTAQLENGFTILSSDIGPVLQTRVQSPTGVRPGREYIFWLEYGNIGSAEMPAPLLIVYSPENVSMRLSAEEPLKTGPVQVLGISFDSTAGILRPGYYYRIPVYFYVPANAPGQIQFNVERMVADNTLIDWSSIESEVRPAEMDSTAWGAIWSNVTTQMGSTWAEYQQRLDEDATYLARYYRVYQGGTDTSLALQPVSQNKTIYSVRDLFQFEMLKASGLSVRSILAGAVDAYTPEPGLSLAFIRLAPQSIDSRCNLGPLGRGWSYGYEITLSIAPDNSVLIKGPGTAQRLFTRNDDGTYRPQTGDYGILTSLSGGIFQLQEKNGLIYSFGTSGRLRDITEPNGNKLTMGYSSGNQVTITHSNGNQLQIEYNGQGRIWRITDAAGRQTFYIYDVSGEHLDHVEEPGNRFTYYTYNSVPGSPEDHSLSSITYPDGTHYYYEYDDRGRLVSESRDNNAERIQYAYDSQGTIFITDAQGNTAKVRLGHLGQILGMQDPMGMVTRLTYDVKYNLAFLVDPENSVYLFGYDDKGNAIGTRNPLGQQVTMNYTPNFNQLSSLEDTKQNLTTFSYDTKGNLLNITYPDTTKREYFKYDTYGNITSITNRRGQTIKYTYNTRGQPTRKDNPDGSWAIYSYDQYNRITSARDTTGSITMQYDTRDFLTKIAYPSGKYFTFEYNNAGQRTKRTDQDGNILNYYYDAAGKLERITDGSASEFIRYEYNIAGRLSRENKGNGTYTTYDYDSVGQILSMVNYAPSGSSTISRFDYTYDTRGNRILMTTLQGTTFYAYDALSQLTAVRYPDGKFEQYVYDSAGNRISVADNSGTTNYNTNSMNQYTQVGGTTYRYDADGNLTKAVWSNQTTTYEYDVENRLVRVVSLEGVWQYTYDALGNRVTVINNGTTRRYIHDPIGLVDVAAEYDGLGNLVARYTHGLGLISKQEISSGTTAYYDFDAMGNTRELTDLNAKILNSYDYSPFGISLLTLETVSNPFQYVGRFGVIDDHGLNLMRNRFYESHLGRFVSPDPINILGGINLYVYCENQPIIYIDPNGLDTWTLTIPTPWGFGVKPTFGWDASNYYFGLGITSGVGGGAYYTQEGNNVSFGWSYERCGASYSSGPPESGFYGGINWYYYPYAGQYIFPLGGNPKFNHGFGIGQGFGAQLGYIAKIPKSTPSSNNMPKQPQNSSSVPVIRPIDPNEKVGPMGFSSDTVNRYIGVNDTLNYLVYFENTTTASAPVQEVKVTDQLDADLDWTTYQIRSISFGDYNIAISEDTQLYYTRLTIPDWRQNTTKEWWVEVTAKFDPSTGLANWTLMVLDPETGQLPLDALAGILPPWSTDSIDRQGYISFRVKPKSTLNAGTQITNYATIQFDIETTINTNTWLNTIADLPPDAPQYPQPANGVTNVSINIVPQWNEPNRATAYDLYFWKTNELKPGSPTVSNLSTPYWNPPETLLYYTLYRWQVVAKNAFGSATSSEWIFQTQLPSPPLNTQGEFTNNTDINYWFWEKYGDGTDSGTLSWISTFANQSGIVKMTQDAGEKGKITQIFSVPSTGWYTAMTKVATDIVDTTKQQKVYLYLQELDSSTAVAATGNLVVQSGAGGFGQASTWRDLVVSFYCQSTLLGVQVVGINPANSGVSGSLYIDSIWVYANALQGTNSLVLTNPSFDYGTTGWLLNLYADGTGIGTWSQASSLYGHAGIIRAKQAGGEKAKLSQVYSADADQTLATVWVYSSATSKNNTQKVYLYVYSYDSVYSKVIESGNGILQVGKWSQGQWRQIRFGYTPLTEYNAVQVVGINPTGNPSGSIYFDGVELKQ